MSTFAGETARMMLLGLAMYSVMRDRVCFSMSVGWSPMGTFRSEQDAGKRRPSNYLCQARKIDQRQTQHMRRVDFEVYRLSVYALVASGNSRGFRFDFSLQLDKVIPTPPRVVVELGPLLIAREVRLGPRSLRFRIAIGRNVDELEDEGTPSDDSASARQEVSADNVFQDRRLSGRLRPYDNLDFAC